MAAEPIGSAYVIIRAITSQLSKDIKDGLDKGAKDVDAEDAGRDIGGRAGEAAGDEFGETWRDRASDGMRDSAGSTEMRRATDRFGDTINERLSDSLGGDETSRVFAERLQSSIDDATRDIDVDDAGETLGSRLSTQTSDTFGEHLETGLGDAVDDVDVNDVLGRPGTPGTLGDDIGTRVAEDQDAAHRRETGRLLSTAHDDDGIRRGVSGFVLGIGEQIGSAFTRIFSGPGGPSQTVGTAMEGFFDKLTLPGGPLIQWGILLGLPFLGAAVQTIGALGGVIVSVLGFIGTAALGAGIGLLGVGAALGPALFGVMAAFAVDSELLTELTENFETFKEKWQVFGASVQPGLFSGLNLAMEKLSSQEMLDIFADYGTALGNALGDAVVDITDQITSEDNLERIKRILGGPGTGGIGVIENLGAALAALVTPVLMIIDAAMPLALELSQSIEDASLKFADFIAQKDESGELTATFDTWWERFKQIGRILWNIAGGLANVFGIGAEAAEPFFDSLEGWSEDFMAWTEDPANQETLRLFFDNAWDIANELWLLIKDIVALIADPLVPDVQTRDVMGISIPIETEGEGTDGILSFIRSLREDWLPTIVDLGTQLGDALRGPVSDFIGKLTDFVTAIGEHPEIAAGFVSLFFPVIAVLVALMGPLTWFIESDVGAAIMKIVLPLLVFGQVLNKIVGIGTIMKGLNWLLMGSQIEGGFVGLLALMGPVGWVVAAIAAVIAAVVLLYFHFKPFREFVDKWIIDPLQRLWDAIGGFEGIADFFTDLGGAVSDFFTGDPLGDIADFFLDIPDLLSEGFESFVDWLIETLEGVPEKIGDFGSNMIEAFTSWIADAGPKAARNFGKLTGKLVRAAILLTAKLLYETIKFFILLPIRIIKAAPKVIAAFVRFFRQVAWPGLLAFGEIVLEWFSNLPSLILTYLKMGANFLVGFLEGLWPEGVQWIRDHVPDIAEAIVDFFLGLPDMIVDALQDLWDAIVGFFLDLWDELVGHSIIPDMIEDIVDWFLGLPGKIVDALLAGLSVLLEGAKDLAGAIWDGIVAGFEALGDAAGWVWDWFVDTVVGTVGTVVGWIADIGETVWGWITTAFDAVVDAIGFVWDWFVDTVLGGLGAAGDLAGSWLATIGSTIWGWITSAFDAITGAIGYVWDWFVDTVLGGIGAAASLAGSWLATIGGTVWGWITSAFDAVTDAIGFVWDWFVDTVLGGIGSAASLAGSWLATIGSTVWGWITSAFDALTGVLGYVWNWFIDTVVGVLGDAPEWIANIGETVWGWITTAFDEVTDAAGYVWDWFIDTVSGVINFADLAGSWFATIATDVWGWITSGFDSITGLATWFWDWFSGIIGTVADIPGALISTIKNIGESFLGWVKDGFDAAVNFLGTPFRWLGDILGRGDPPDVFDQGQIDSMVLDAFTSFQNTFSAMWQEFDGRPPSAKVEELINGFENLGVEGASAVKNLFHENVADGIITDEEMSDIFDLFEAQVDAEVSSVSFGEAFSGIWNPDDLAPSSEDFAEIIEQFSNLGIDSAAAVQGAFDTSMEDGIIDQTEFDAIIQMVRDLIAGADVTTAADTFAANTRTAVDTALDREIVEGSWADSMATNWRDRVGGAWGNVDWSQVDFETPAAAGMAAVTGSLTDAASDLSTFDPTTQAIADSLGIKLGERDADMVAPTNKLVDMILLTLSRVGNEVDNRMVNPFVLKMVVGINKAATESVKATNRLVDKVMLTLSRIGNETERTMNPFILRLVDSINKASSFAVSATKSLVDKVLLTLARIPNEVTRVLAPLASAMVSVLGPAGARAADSLDRGFRSGMAGFISYLHGFDNIINNAVGDLSDVWYDKGRQLVQGLMNGVNDTIGKLSVQAIALLSFARGGIVPGAPGAARMAVVHGGELILNIAQQQAVGDAVGRWAGVAAQALRLAGQSNRWLGDLLLQMKHESGGNPNAINRWDSNWIAGHPSMGLMQTIQSTFNANAGALITRGILDPLANIFAAIMYTLRRYGDLGYWRRNNFRGYSAGGIISGPTLALLGEAGREAVVPLTRPHRALEVMHMAGLDALVQPGQNKAFPPGTDVAMLRIDHAEIFDKVDVDIIAARIRKAYTSMAGR